MTRGRSKDLSIPTSRALIQQRDYRARKAKYLSDLEERCRRAEDENEKLRKELELARGGILVRHATFSSETAQATTDLMQHLNAASASLARFQQMAFIHNQPLPSNSSVSTRNRPDPLALPTASSSFSHATNPFYSPYDEINTQSESFPKSIDISSTTDVTKQMRQTLSESPVSDEECCGGFVDCRGLAEDEPHAAKEHIPSNSLVNNSNVRSTSDGAPTP